MIDRRAFLGATGAGAAALALGSCARSGSSGAKTIRYWGMGAADKANDEKVAAAFAATPAGKGVTVAISQPPSNGVSDMSQIITAVRGGTAPDLWWMDRFNAVQNASVGLLEPIGPLIEKYEGVSPTEFMKQWVQFAVDELTYDGQVYGLPTTTDARGLLYNENVLREGGVDLGLFDPDQHTLTWDEMHEVCAKVTKKDGRGNYERLGFAPWLDEGWPYTWAFGLGAEAYDNARSRVTLDTDAWKAVYQLYRDWADEYPYASVDAFMATYQPPNAPPSQTAIFSGRLAMSTGGPWQNASNEKYAPKLPLKWTWLPVAKEGDPHYTWSGGQSLVIPKGAEITEHLWNYMKFHAGRQGLNIIVPHLGNLPTDLQALADKTYNPKAELFQQMLPTSRSRPPLPVGSAIWDTLTRTKSSVTIGSQTPAQCAASNQAYIEPKMALFPGYEMPDTYGKDNDLTPPASPA